MYVCVCVFVFFQFILDVGLVDVPAGVTQEEGHTGFLIHLPSAVLALIFYSFVLHLTRGKIFSYDVLFVDEMFFC